jgi:hypothetical protein
MIPFSAAIDTQERCLAAMPVRPGQTRLLSQMKSDQVLTGDTIPLSPRLNVAHMGKDD